MASSIIEVDGDVIGDQLDYLSDVLNEYGHKTRLTLAVQTIAETINHHLEHCADPESDATQSSRERMSALRDSCDTYELGTGGIDDEEIDY